MSLDYSKVEELKQIRKALQSIAFALDFFVKRVQADDKEKECLTSQKS
jgi:hypothetical protein